MTLPIGSGYPAAQLARALTHAAAHDDAQAQERVRRWTDALLGMLGGSIAAGGRQPVAGLPAWVTLEVVTGGFATGRALAAGPLRPHEQQLLGELGLADAPDPRLALNRYFLSEAGLARLVEALEACRYEIEVPEESALLVVAWLVQQGQTDEARDLIDVLAPHLGHLRFYPALTDAPRSHGTRVHLEDVATTSRRLKAMRPDRRVLAQREAIEIWTPLYDRLIAAFLDTVVGDAPVAQKDETGAWRRGPKGQFIVTGGWPCARRPEGWDERAAELRSAFGSARKRHRLCGKASRHGEVLAMLGDSLGRALESPDALTGRDVGRIRLALGRYIAVRGVPAADRVQRLRRRQWEHATAPTHQEIAGYVVAERLASLRQNEGVDDIGPLVADIEPGAVAEGALRSGAGVPASVVRKLQRSVRDSIDGLVKRGIVSSGEVLAQVLPQLTSGLRAAGISDRGLRDLYAANYRAFRRRRSLLLLDLQKQVRIEELPWAASIDRRRAADFSGAEASRQALVETSVIALRAFPRAMLPNKLIRELDTLSCTATLNLPLTEELAADIFMGRFSPKFVDAVRAASPLLRGSLYSRYYRIDFAQVIDALSAGDEKAARPGRSADALARLCAERAGVALGTWRPATNGRIIEQQLILTTHNLASLVSVPGVAAVLADHWDDMARRCFEWVLAHLQLPQAGHHVALIRIKNAAYAWRQMVFFLSCTSDRIEPFLAWADERLHIEAIEFRARFEPALRELQRAAGFTDPGDDSLGQRSGPFLGWVEGRHWLMPARSDVPARARD